jgi:hypothetical protein
MPLMLTEILGLVMEIVGKPWHHENIYAWEPNKKQKEIAELSKQTLTLVKIRREAITSAHTRTYPPLAANTRHGL